MTDIDKLSKIRPAGPKGLGGCTIPQALMLFAILDYFGFLIRDDSANPSPKDTTGGFKYMLCQSNYLPKEYAETFERIVKLFRHGYVHQVFPKAAGIAKAGPHKALLSRADQTLTLNVDVLTRDVLSALARIKDEILQDRNETLVLRINGRLNILNKADYDILHSCT